MENTVTWQSHTWVTDDESTWHDNDKNANHLGPEETEAPASSAATEHAETEFHIDDALANANHFG